MQPDELHALIGEIEDTAAHHADGVTQWKQVWNAIKNVGASFKQVRFPLASDREGAWQRYQSAVENIKRVQNAEFERRANWCDHSETHLAKIENLASLAERDDGLFDVLVTFFTGGLNLVGRAALDAIFGKLDDARNDLLSRGRYLKNAGDYFQSHKAQMLGKHKFAAHQKLSDVRERLNADWDNYKRNYEGAKEARQRDWEGRQSEHREKRDRWLSGQRDFIGKLQSSKGRLAQALDYKRENHRKLEDMRENAKGDDFRRRVDDWIDENDDAIRSIRGKIESIEDKIREVESKTND